MGILYLQILHFLFLFLDFRLKMFSTKPNTGEKREMDVNFHGVFGVGRQSTDTQPMQSLTNTEK